MLMLNAYATIFDDIRDRALVWLGADGILHYETILTKDYPSLDVGRLLACIEDNIIEEADGTEHIHWNGACEDFLYQPEG